MDEPATHALSDRAKALYAHLQHLLFIGWNLGKVAIIVGIVALLWAARDAVKHAGEVRVAEKAAAVTPAMVPDAKLKTHLFGPDEHALTPATFGGTAPRPGSAKPHPAPVAHTVPAAPTPANPHPEVTVAQAQVAVAPPAVTVFTVDPRDVGEIERTYGVDLGRYYPVTQRQDLPQLRYGARGMGFIPAGGGQVTYKILANPRPRVGWPRMFEIHAGASGTAAQLGGVWRFDTGAVFGAAWEPIRVGDWYLHVETDWRYLPNAIDARNRVTGEAWAARRFGGED